MRKPLMIAGLALCLASANNARAQQYSPLTVAPKVNLTFAVDVSHEMALRPDGSDFVGRTMFGHRLAELKQTLIAGGPNDPAAALFPFRNEFLWSGFAYSGSQFAKIKNGSVGPFAGSNTIRVPPSTQNPTTISNSYNQVVTMVDGLVPDYCVPTKQNPACTEDRLPGMPSGSLPCITPSAGPGCPGDMAVIDAVINGGLSGFTLPTGLAAMDMNTEIVCDDSTYPPSVTLQPAVAGLSPFTCEDATPGVAPWSIRPICELAHELHYFAWPRFPNGNVNVPDVRDRICEPLRIAFANVQAKIDACLLASPTVPVDLTPGPGTSAGPGGYRCEHAPIAANLCDGSSPFGGSATGGTPTCVCDQSDPQCVGAIVNDDCGEPMSLLARNQVAMCFSHNPDPSPTTSPIFNGLRSQPDNALNASGCRGNMIMYVTDGLGGDTPGVAAHALRNLSVYRTDDPPGPMIALPQNFVVRTGGRPQAAVMQDVIYDDALNGFPNAPVDGTDVDAVRSTMSQALNRNLRGTYSAANLAFDRNETRVAIMSYEVPGGPDLDNDAFSSYLGRPSRISWHSVSPAGVISPTPLWETDYATKAGFSASGGPVTTLYLNGFGSFPAGDQRIGPGGTWASGTPKEQARNTGGSDRLDRNGDGAINGADVTPEPIRWGYFDGAENAQPMIVEAPRDVPAGSGTAFAQYQRIPAIANRPRTILGYSNGWIVGFHGGEAASGGYTVGLQRVEQAYRDDPNSAAGVRYDATGVAGRELFRIRPSFIYDVYAAGVPPSPATRLINFNEASHQNLMNGHMLVREVLMQGNPERYATVLFFTQGSAGRGIAAVDITDPEAGNLSIAAAPNANTVFNSAVNGPAQLWERPLQNTTDRATAKPAIYLFPQAKTHPIDPNRVTVWTTVGGAGGTNNLYAYRVRDGSLLSQAALPGAAQQSYRVAPVCVDTDGRGASYCYALRSDGFIARVAVNRVNGTFGAVFPINSPAMAPGRTFWTEPVVTFGQDNSIVLFLASGNIETLGDRTSNNNALFKIVDRITSRSGGGIDTGTVCAPDGGGNTASRINFDNAQEMVVSPPVLAKGVLAYTTYLPGTDGCTLGQAKVYTMNYETCSDARTTGGGLRPAGRSIGDGIPTSPSILRRAETVVTHTSRAPTGDVAAGNGARGKGGALIPVQRSFYAPLRIVK